LTRITIQILCKLYPPLYHLRFHDVTYGSETSDDIAKR